MQFVRVIVVARPPTLVAVWPPRVWGRRGPPTPRLSIISPAVAQDAVSAAAAFIIVLSLALGGRLSELSRLLVDTAAFGGPSS